MADLQWTYFFLEQTDPDLSALIDRRTSRLMEMDYTFKPVARALAKPATATAAAAPKANPLRALALEQADYLTARFSEVDNLYALVEHLAMASFRGYAHAEKWYDEGGVLAHFEIVDQWNVVRDGFKGGWKYNPRAWQTGYFGLPAENIVTPESFVIRTVPRPINRIALLKWVCKKLAEADWDAFLEIYGIPSGVVIGPPNVTDANKRDFEDAAETIAKGGSGYLPFGSLYEKNDMPRGGAPFKERLDFLTEKLILVGTGGMLTMLSKSGSGTLAGGAHTDTFEQLAKSEARKVSETINQQVVDAELDAAFPGQPHLAYFELAAQEETKLGEIVEHISTLSSAGYQVNPDVVTERTGYTVTLKPQPAALKPMAETGVDGRNADPETGDPAAIANRATTIGAAVFDHASQRSLTEEQLAAVQPLLDRVAALSDVPAADYPAALEKLLADAPALLLEARGETPGVDEVWAHVLAVAMAQGLAQRPAGSPAP